MQHLVTTILATKDMDFMRPTVTFNERAQTVMVTGGPVSTLTDDYKEVFRRASDMAACVTLAHQLKNNPTTWPYGRFIIGWKDDEQAPQATFLGYGQATDGCYNEIAGTWQGDEEGLATAGRASSDTSEIRVASTTVKGVNSGWRRRLAEGHGLEPFAADDAVSLGFDPVENAAYVWARDPDGALLGRAQRSHFRDVVATNVCENLMSEYSANSAWPYTRWSIALYQGNAAFPEIIASGDCLPAP